MFHMDLSVTWYTLYIHSHSWQSTLVGYTATDLIVYISLEYLFVVGQ
jgi:hypothetical protein